MRSDSAIYRRRASLYRSLDGRLCTRTRFFAGAALICEALAPLDGSLARLGLPPAAKLFLDSVSGELETLNVRMATVIERTRWEGRRLDAVIVHMEQTHVQSRLATLQDCRGTQAEIVSPLNQLCNSWSSLLLLQAYARSEFVPKTLRATRRALRRPIDFARQSDREEIGNRLIAAVAASRAPGCP